ncbi:MAG: hypothetical protein ACERKD_02765 [Prolixibacteraceae bacterium]
MYITNFQHCLNSEGNIPTDMPREARELANFFALLIDEASTGDYDAEPTIRCIKKGCEGVIVPSVIEDTDEIFWVCVKCKTKGVISNWRGTKWDIGLM